MIYEKILNLINENIDFCLITIINVQGSAPQDLAAKCIVTQDGLYFGTVGGGKVEAHAIKLAIENLQNKIEKKLEVHTWNLQTDIGMSCGGVVTFSFDYHFSNTHPVYIFGAGHVSQALCETLAKLPFQVTCIDPRVEWTSKLPPTIKALTTDMTEEIISLAPKNTFFISMTQGHAFDVPILNQISKLHPQARFVGVIGSDIKGRKIKNELLELGCPVEFIEKLKCPIGLDLGSNNPYEIAISIIAQLLMERDQ